MTRSEIVELLPFYVNGSLPPEERLQVEAALHEDASLRTERDLLRQLRDQMQDEIVQSPGELGLSRLMAQLDRETPANLPRAPRLWQIAAVVLLGVAVLQGILLVAPESRTDPYELAGGNEPEIVVSIRPDVTEGALRQALLDAGLIIVDGPSALGLYGLAPLDGVDVEEAERTLLEASIIESAQ